DDRIAGPAHADVGDVGRAAGEDTFVGGLDVGMGADDGGAAAVEVPAHGDLFGGGLGVHIHQDTRGLAPQGVHFAGGGLKRAVEGFEGDASLKIHGAKSASRRGGEDYAAATRGLLGIVGGADEVRQPVDRRGELFLAPGVVAQRKALDTKAFEVAEN